MLGYTTDDGDQPVPQLVTALEGHIVKWVAACLPGMCVCVSQHEFWLPRAVSAGGWHTMALCDDGVYAFGYSSHNIPV
jgi:hypothetical protein